MRLSSIFKLGPLAVAACFGAAVSGCFFSDGSDGGGPPPTDDYPPDGPSAHPQTVSIDTDATVKVTGGDGVGVFVQYAAGGHWEIFTSCDTNTSQTACGFDLFVAPTDVKAVIGNPKGQELAGDDTLVLQSDGSLHLSTETTTALNGFSFDATPDATIELEMYLDGDLQERFIYWSGDKILHAGAPTNPVDFKPQAAPTSK